MAEQLFAKKREKCEPALLRRERGVSRDNKTISRATSADRSIVSRNALPSFDGFSFSFPENHPSPPSPFYPHVQRSPPRLTFTALDPIYSRIRG